LLHESASASDGVRTALVSRAITGITTRIDPPIARARAVNNGRAACNNRFRSIIKLSIRAAQVRRSAGIALSYKSRPAYSTYRVCVCVCVRARAHTHTHRECISISFPPPLSLFRSRQRKGRPRDVTARWHAKGKAKAKASAVTIAHEVCNGSNLRRQRICAHLSRGSRTLVTHVHA